MAEEPGRRWRGDRGGLGDRPPYDAGIRETAILPDTAVGRAYLQRQQEMQIQDAYEDLPAPALMDLDTPIGAFIRPRENSLRGYKAVLRQNDGTLDIQFSQYNYAAFDGIIVAKCGVDRAGKSDHAAFNSDHPHHENYAPLRRNIAIVRNYLLSTMYPQGMPIGGGEGMLKLQHMASKLGEALAGETPHRFFLERWWDSIKRVFAKQDISAQETNDFLKAANIPDRGAAVMYNYLVSLQNKPSIRDWLPFTKSASGWNIPPIEESPFSQDNIIRFSRANSMVKVADALDIVVQQLHSVETLNEIDKTESVEHARRILEKLRINLGHENDGMLVEIKDPVRGQAQQLLQLAVIYRSMLAELIEISPNLQNSVTGEAIEAVEQLAFRAKVAAQIMLKEEGETGAAQQMAERIARTPDRFRTPLPLGDLINKIEAGIFEASGKAEQAKAKSASPQSVAQSFQAAPLSGYAPAVTAGQKEPPFVSGNTPSSDTVMKGSMDDYVPVVTAAAQGPKTSQTQASAVFQQAAKLEPLQRGRDNFASGMAITSVSDKSFVDMARKVNEGKKQLEHNPAAPFLTNSK